MHIYIKGGESTWLKELYFAYEGCPVATVYIGYLGKINEHWVMATDLQAMSYYSIPKEYHHILEKYFFKGKVNGNII